MSSPLVLRLLKRSSRTGFERFSKRLCNVPLRAFSIYCLKAVGALDLVRLMANTLFEPDRRRNGTQQWAVQVHCHKQHLGRALNRPEHVLSWLVRLRVLFQQR
jgi:hypothetical protein